MGSFALDISKWCQKADANMHHVVRKIAFEAFKRVVLKTPVDTGRARANWGVMVGQPNTTSSTLSYDKDGAATLRNIFSNVSTWSCQGSIFLCNSVKYIVPLEYGHSKQAPLGMVRLTVEEMLNFGNGDADDKA